MSDEVKKEEVRPVEVTDTRASALPDVESGAADTLVDMPVQADTSAENAQEAEATPPPGEAGDAPTNSPDAPPSAPPAIPGPPPTHAVLVLEANGQGTIGVVLVAEAFQVPPGAQPDLMHLQMPFVLRHAYHMKEYRRGDETEVKPFGPFELLVNEGNVRNALQDEAKAFQEWTVMAQRIVPAQGPLPEGPMPPGGPRGPYGRPLRGRPRPRR